MSTETEKTPGNPAPDAVNDDVREQHAPALDAAGLVARVDELEAELAAARDERLRALAEVENVRRRGQREKDDALKFGATSLARDLLSVADNLRRAVAAIPADVRAENPAFEAVAQGVEMVERELLGAFEKQRIRKVEPAAGERFDPNLHQAMYEVETPAMAPGSVVQVLQPGYTIADRLLRPAMVGVSKAPAGPVQGVDTLV